MERDNYSKFGLEEPEISDKNIKPVRIFNTITQPTEDQAEKNEKISGEDFVNRYSEIIAAIRNNRNNNDNYINSNPISEQVNNIIENSEEN
ncbi:hypothetical protein LBMAG33_3910 [Candidatus Levyibacteriota bacterium]|nr:hypothetical protein [Candidatus Levybacteria bacterium]GDX62081.1 hypothetical protein LBMAG33_3910 [Candidatus Levybacteria bacterium]